MPQRLSRGATKRIDHILATLDSITDFAGRISEEAVRDLVRRAAIPSRPDGYPANTSLSEKGSHSGSDSSSTEGAGFARNPEWAEKRKQPQFDVVQRRLFDIERKLGDALADVRSVVESFEYLGANLEEVRQRPVTTPCAVCQELPAEKAGYCRKDYDHWRDYGSPDRMLWEMFKREERTGDQLRVPECPPPSSGRTARRGPWKSAHGGQ